ncbi:hypothetical protein [Sphingobacterium faecium]
MRTLPAPNNRIISNDNAGQYGYICTEPYIINYRDLSYYVLYGNPYNT